VLSRSLACAVPWKGGAAPAASEARVVHSDAPQFATYSKSTNLACRLYSTPFLVADILMLMISLPIIGEADRQEKPC